MKADAKKTSNTGTATAKRKKRTAAVLNAVVNGPSTASAASSSSAAPSAPPKGWSLSKLYKKSTSRNCSSDLCDPVWSSSVSAASVISQGAAAVAAENSSSSSAVNSFATSGAPSGKDSLVVVFDIETTDLPKGDNFDNVRIVQMCCALCCRSTLEEKERVSVIIKTDGFPVLLSEIHGITEEISLRDGELFEAAATRVGALFCKASAVIAHNVQFDVPAFKRELSRYNMLALLTIVDTMSQICSMNNTRISSLIYGTGCGVTLTLKYASLDELYFFATNQPLPNHHNATDDVENLIVALKVLITKYKLVL